MRFAIIRTKKLKTIGAIARSGMHTFREAPTPNSNQDFLSDNVTVGARSTCELKKALAERLPDKIRAGAVLCIEYLITASPEAFKRHGGTLNDLGDGYFKESLIWLYKRHGKQNVICSTLHLDETTPHLVVYVVPITHDNRLSCRDFLGGPAKMKKMQTDFYDACAKKYGLARGIEGSKAKHQEINKFYSVLNSKDETPVLRFRDYAAAALGVKSSRIKKSEAIGLNKSKRLFNLELVRKTINSRLNGVRKLEQVLRRRIESLKLREAVLLNAESDLNSKMQMAAQRESKVGELEYEDFILRAENDALRRRVYSLESKLTEKPENQKKSLRHDRGVTYG